MKGIYSVGAPFAYPGLGKTAAYAAEALFKNGLIQKVLCPMATEESEIPKENIRYFPCNWLTGRVHSRIRHYTLKDEIYDKWASLHVGPCDLFYGWAHHSLHSLRKAKKSGGICVLDKQSAEPDMQNRILVDEFKKFGVSVPPIAPANLNKMLTEDKETDYIMTPSTFVRDSYLEKGFDEKKILVNPLGVDLKRFSPSSQKSTDHFQVLYLGALSIQKGLVTIIQAWKKLNLSNATLNLVGPVEQSSKDVLEKELCDVANIKLCGPTTEPEKYFQEADLFVFPSNQDGFASVVLEAMACETAVIVSANTGAKDCVRENTDGFQISTGSVDELCEKIQYFHLNRDECTKMGLQAREQALSFTWQAYQKRLVDIIKLCLT